MRPVERGMLAAYRQLQAASENLANRVALAFPVGREFTLRTERSGQYYYTLLRVTSAPCSWYQQGTVSAENVVTLKKRKVNIPFSLSRGEIT